MLWGNGAFVCGGEGEEDGFARSVDGFLEGEVAGDLGGAEGREEEDGCGEGAEWGHGSLDTRAGVFGHEEVRRESRVLWG